MALNFLNRKTDLKDTIRLGNYILERLEKNIRVTHKSGESIVIDDIELEQIVNKKFNAKKKEISKFQNKRF